MLGQLARIWISAISTPEEVMRNRFHYCGVGRPKPLASGRRTAIQHDSVSNVAWPNRLKIQRCCQD
jgi:hypothetical protein